jgi:hypothetical protein
MYEEISCDIIRIPKCRNNSSRTLDSCTKSEWWEWGYTHIFEYTEECNYWRWYEWSKQYPLSFTNGKEHGEKAKDDESTIPEIPMIFLIGSDQE